MMNNNTNLRMNAFLIAVALLFTITVSTATVTMLPAAYAEGDDDGDKDEKTDGNKIKAEDESIAVLADCDENKVEEASFECVAASTLRFTGQDLLINGISETLLSDEEDPSPQEALTLPS